MPDLMKAISTAMDPVDIYTALEAVVDDTIGVRLFTLMEIDPARGVARRSYTNMPDAYPTGGEKEIEANIWTAAVLDRQECFIANSIDEIAAVFPDHALIASLGCESCLNLPIAVAGRVIGTLNCLHETGHFTDQRVAAAQTLLQPGALVFLAAHYLRKTQT